MIRGALLALAGWAALAFVLVSGCAALVPAAPSDATIAKAAQGEKLALFLCAMSQAEAHAMPAEQALVEFCSTAEALAPWLERAAGCAAGGQPSAAPSAAGDGSGGSSGVPGP